MTARTYGRAPRSRPLVIAGLLFAGARLPGLARSARPPASSKIVEKNGRPRAAARTRPRQAPRLAPVARAPCLAAHSPAASRLSPGAPRFITHEGSGLVMITRAAYMVGFKHRSNGRCFRRLGPRTCSKKHPELGVEELRRATEVPPESAAATGMRVGAPR